MEKFLIVGLGNIGPEYVGTRHNIGFRMVDALAAEKEAVWEDRRYGFITRISVKGRQLILLKPSTYMNLSGNAVRYWMQQEKIALEHLLICVDDISLPFGQLRMKPSGSDAGHNGLKHIAQVLGTQQYARLRFGIGQDYFPGQQVDYVLGTFPPEQEELIPERTKVTTGAIKTFCLAGIQLAMNECNRRGTPLASTPKENQKKEGEA
ncbi:MAG: aminoacyl-tRNA hydrolase [Bacteroidaceae bacterium]|nr:aminoacyl-tRNA hydrolase [Bacteroidaceae bacterium]